MNLGMIIGSDGKLNTILGTLQVAENRCKKIVICDTGNWVVNSNIKDLIESYKNTTYILPMRSTVFNLFDARTTVMNSFDQDEWFLFMDGDERPSLSLFEDWNTITQTLNERNIKIGTISGSPHFYGERLNPTPEWFETVDRKSVSHSNLFVKKIVVKKSFSVKSVNHGNHSDWMSNDGLYEYVGNGFIKNKTYYYIHIKTSFQKANGHVMCAHNIYDVNWHLPTNELVHHQKILELNNKYGLFTSNDVVKFIMEHDDYPNELLEYMLFLGHESKNASLAIFLGIWAFYISLISRKISVSDCSRKSEILRKRLKENISLNADLPFKNISYDETKTFKENYIELLNEKVVCNNFCCKYGNIQL